METLREHIRAVVDNAVDGIIVIDSKGIIEQFNPAAERMFGYANDEVIGNNISMLMPSPYKENHDHYLQNVMSTGVKRIIGSGREVAGKRKNGSTFPMELAVSEMRIGEQRKFTGIIRDITDRKLAEARIRSIVETAVDGIIVIDRTGVIQNFNPAAERMFGYSSEEAVGQSVSLLMPSPYLDHHKEYLNNYLHTGIKRVIGIGREVVGKRKNGSTFPMELAVSEMKIEQDISFTGIVRDITDRKRAEARIQSIVQTAVDGIIVINSEGIIEQFNPAAERLFGYSDKEVINKNISMLMPSSYKDEHDHYLRDYLTTGLSRVIGQGVEMVAQRKDGSSFPIELAVSEMKIGEERKFTGIIHDITDRKQAYECIQRAAKQAEEANRAKSEFLATISHEIRTPMNSILGIINLLLDTNLTPEQYDFASTVRSSAESLLSIINDILDFSKIEAGKMTLDLVSFNLLGTIEGVCELFAVRAAEKRVHLVVSYPNNVPLFMIGDPGRVRQVVMNLVSNAVKFTSAGHVLISAELLEKTNDQAHIRITVEDTGIGIDVAVIQKLFARFIQADSSTTRRFGGTGLGLAITKSLVSLMKGSITAHSEIGKGSTFVVSIWFGLVDQSQFIEPNVSLCGKKVLVADEDPTSCSVMTRQLKMIGLISVGVTSINEAVLELQRQQEKYYDLMFIDRSFGVSSTLTSCIRKLTHVIGVVFPVDESVIIQDSWCIATISRPIRWSHMSDFLLQVLNFDSMTTSPTITQHQTVATFHSISALLVEDNLVNQKVATINLQKLGCDVDVACNGEEGVRMLSKRCYDIVFMDCQMPVMDGYEATRIIRSNFPNWRVPIIALTANAMKGDRERCLVAGMDGYLTKPLLKEDLIQVLHKWCPI